MAAAINLIVIEPEYHPEVLRSLVLVALEVEQVELSVFTSQSLWNRAFKEPPQEVKTFLAPHSKEVFPLLQEKKALLEKADIVWFNTLATQYKAFIKLGLKHPQLVLRVHNTASAFQAWRHFLWPRTPYSLFKTLSHLLRIELLAAAIFYRKRALQKFDFFLFPTDAIARSAAVEFKVLPGKILQPSLPLVTRESNLARNGQHKPLPSQKTIAIPGSFNLKRRDYVSVYQSLKELPPQKDKLHIHFLGPVQGRPAERLRQKMQSLHRRDLKLYFYQDFVPEDTFQAVIEKAWFLLLPLHQSVRYRIFEERYGASKVSGSVNDVIRFGKPALIPHFYPIPQGLEALFKAYQAPNDLAVKINSWLIKPPEQSTNGLAVYAVKEQALLLEQLLHKIIRA
jgi:hypothetical protein